MDTLFKQLVANGEDEKEAKLKSSVFFVEANSCEKLELWKECGEEYKIDIKQDNYGFSQIIGHINDDKEMPVCLCFSFNIIEGCRVCFYESTSRFSDRTMIEEWLKENYPVKWDRGTRTAMTNAMNFHHAIDHIREIKTEA